MLAQPPDFMDTPCDQALAALPYELGRGRNKAGRLAWRWECSVRGPSGSPYYGQSYRVLVRLPLGYPAMAPKLHVLSTITHLEVETRDPYEGAMDESFYECLTERMKHGGAGDRAASTVSDGQPGEAAATPTVAPSHGLYTILGLLELFIEAMRGPLPNLTPDIPAPEVEGAEEITEAARLEGVPVAVQDPKVCVGTSTAAEAAAVEVAEAEEAPGANASIGVDHGTSSAAGASAMSQTAAAYHRAWKEVASQHKDDLDVARSYRRVCLHGQLLGSDIEASWLAPSLVALFEDGLPSPTAVRAFVEEVAPGIYAFDWFTSNFCEARTQPAPCQIIAACSQHTCPANHTCPVEEDPSLPSCHEPRMPWPSQRLPLT